MSGALGRGPYGQTHRARLASDRKVGGLPACASVGERGATSAGACCAVPWAPHATARPP